MSGGDSIAGNLWSGSVDTYDGAVHEARDIHKLTVDLDGGGGSLDNVKGVIDRGYGSICSSCQYCNFGLLRKKRGHTDLCSDDLDVIEELLNNANGDTDARDIAGLNRDNGRGGEEGAGETEGEGEGGRAEELHFGFLEYGIKLLKVGERL